MDILDIGVLKEGIFFNKIYKDIRKCLITNFNIRKVISVPQDQFENTSTKTSIIIFDNTDIKTTKILFKNLMVERYSKDLLGEVLGEIAVIENKGDIKCVNDVLISEATADELLMNSMCSLNGKDYIKKNISVRKDHEFKRIGELCEFKKGKQLSKQNFMLVIWKCRNYKQISM